MCLGQPAVAGPTKTMVTDSVGDTALDPSASPVVFLPLGRALLTTCVLQCLVLFLVAHDQVTTGSGTLGTQGTHRAWRAVAVAEPDTYHRCAATVMLKSPTGTDLALRTGRVLGLPVDGKRGDIKVLTSGGLPAGVGRNRPDQMHPVVVFGCQYRLGAAPSRGDC